MHTCRWRPPPTNSSSSSSSSSHEFKTVSFALARASIRYSRCRGRLPPRAPASSTSSLLSAHRSVDESFMQRKVRGWFPVKDQGRHPSAHTHTGLTGEVGGRWEGLLEGRVRRQVSGGQDWSGRQGGRMGGRTRRRGG